MTPPLELTLVARAERKEAKLRHYRDFYADSISVMSRLGWEHADLITPIWLGDSDEPNRFAGRASTRTEALIAIRSHAAVGVS